MRHLVAVGVAAAVAIAVALLATTPGRVAGNAAGNPPTVSNAAVTSETLPGATTMTRNAPETSRSTNITASRAAASTTTTASGFAIGGRFCLNCHQEQPRVSRVYPVGRVEHVEGFVVKSISGFVVVMNGTNVYHVRLPLYCGQPKPGSRISLDVYIVRGAEAGMLHWLIGRATRCG